MRNFRSYYSATIADFLRQPISDILGTIHANDISAETTIQQNNAWESEIHILKDQLRSFADGRIIFEYTIPRMGNGEEKALLEDILKTQQDMDGVTAEENFILGFRLGVRLMTECLTGEDMTDG